MKKLDAKFAGILVKFYALCLGADVEVEVEDRPNSITYAIWDMAEVIIQEFWKRWMISLESELLREIVEEMIDDSSVEWGNLESVLSIVREEVGVHLGWLDSEY